MKLGIKVGPQPSSLIDLAQTNPDCAEVWFFINRLSEYDTLFTELKRRRIDIGLHFWGSLADGTVPNLAYPDPVVINQTVALMRQTIDTAASHGFSYVNIHPGSQINGTIDFEKESFVQKTDPVDPTTAQNLFLEHVTGLCEYATRRGIVFTVETVPARISKFFFQTKPDSRNYPVNAYELPPSTVLAAANHGLWVANDFGHTSSIITQDAQTAWEFLVKTTTDLAPKTRLIHLGYVVPPYNGIDFHDMLDNPLLDTNQAVPNKKQIIELLKLFANRDDIWTLTEPRQDHVKNYFLAKEMLENAFS